jgi:LysR family transcriptional activator of nhaA
VHTVVDRAALKRYGLRVIARVEECGSDFFAITAERRVKHPAVLAITKYAYTSLFVDSKPRSAGARRPKP